MSYHLLPEPQPVSILGCWEPNVAPFTHVVGYSNLGHFFLLNSNSEEFAVLHPFRQAYKSYGQFNSVSDFEQIILKDAGFGEYVLKPEHQAAIQEFAGSLSEAEVYIPQPYPFLGGSEEPTTYSIGNVWTFAELVGRCHGFA
ncbi:hypothetical protein [Pseudomonas sp.]|uniref:hypothetical protein n=1 Tax=Pseudomonas sp. TaxID=306 RepID=UPI003CC67B5B|tara:strand:+ start:635 stop:1060 length:426 start_codon:yes stop_codon:yes gene_type:complete